MYLNNAVRGDAGSFEYMKGVRLLFRDFVHSNELHCYAQGCRQEIDTIYMMKKNTFMLTYHSNNVKDKSLLEICEAYPNHYFRFFTIN